MQRAPVIFCQQYEQINRNNGDRNFKNVDSYAITLLNEKILAVIKINKILIIPTTNNNDRDDS